MSKPACSSSSTRGLPPFTIIPSGKLFILRDDLLPGGTKRRALGCLLPTMPQTDFAYAGTVFGHGALALALACADHGKTAHLFLSCNDPDHPMLEKILAAGAIIRHVAPLPVADLNGMAAAWALQTGACHFSLAFDCPDFHHAMVASLSVLEISAYPELWCTAVSGTFARALRAAFPNTLLKTVSVVAGTEADFYAPEKYHRPALLPPAYSACPHTDAKLWRFAQATAADGALVWNIAG